MAEERDAGGEGEADRGWEGRRAGVGHKEDQEPLADIIRQTLSMERG